MQVDYPIISNTLEHFSWDIFSKVVAQGEEHKNIILSPLGVVAALYMTYNGAATSTQTAMSKTLALKGISEDALNNAYKSLSKALESSTESTHFAMFNAAFYDEQRLTPDRSYFSKLINAYQAEIFSEDFNKPNLTLAKINSWVEDKTKGHVKRLLEKIDPDEFLFLLNALYFRANWEIPFSKDHTLDRAFQLENGNTVDVPTMFLDKELKSIQMEDFSAVELSFSDPAYAMQFILPNSEERIRTWINKDRLAKINHCFKLQAKRERRYIFLPKFEFNYKIKLNDALKALGMEIAFSEAQADFSNFGEVSIGNPYLTRVEQKTYLKIDEFGAEGAAITAALFGSRSLPPSIRFNRPFLINLIHKPSNAYIFSGIIQNPLEKN